MTFASRETEETGQPTNAGLGGCSSGSRRASCSFPGARLLANFSVNRFSWLDCPLICIREKPSHIIKAGIRKIVHYQIRASLR